MSTADVARGRQELRRRYVDLGLHQGQQLLVLDLAKCTRCDECVRACADSHGGVTRLVRDGPRFGHFLVALSCRSCHDPKCVTECPVNAIHRDGMGLEIRIDDTCIGCSLCAHNCPFGSIQMIENGVPVEAPLPAVVVATPARPRLRAVNCDLCNDAPSLGPRCVYACPHDAAHRTTGEDVFRAADEWLDAPGFWTRFVRALGF